MGKSNNFFMCLNTVCTTIDIIPYGREGIISMVVLRGIKRQGYLRMLAVRGMGYLW